ncbi:MAG: alpha/beta fold hydrolase [Alphaproteobacteria bacterium]|nr:alpha/beta fold hydrolase [Alphaproteobacteria bacterium]
MPDPRLPPPPTRLMAPRPLGLHLAAAMATWTASLGASTNSSGASPFWSMLAREHPGLASALARASPEALRGALSREIRARAASFLRGIDLYRRHPHARPATAWPVAWSEGTTRLLDCAPGGSGPPVLLVPSLVNRASILDLAPGRSFVRALAAAGLRPFLVDWDRPGDIERGWDLDSYVAGRLLRCLDHVVAATGAPAILLGYCMGGLLAAPLALLRPAAVRGLVLLATPWDFHAERPDLALALAAQARGWLPAAEAIGEVPVDVLQGLFAALDPLLAARKFIAFSRMDQASEEAIGFVALEDWLNDGVPLAARVARETMVGWYGDNDPALGRWRIGGRPVRPAEIAAPTLCVVPARDRIVPPASARALADAIRGARLVAPPLGHIGMMSSPRAPASLWPGIVGWIRQAAAS